MNILCNALCLLVCFLSYVPDSFASDVFSPRGIGGGGGLFSPAISDVDPDFWLVASDMSGVYRSSDGGAMWSMIPTREIANTARSTPPAFFTKSIFWYSIYSIFQTEDMGLTWAKLKWPWKTRSKISGLSAYRGGDEYLFVSSERDCWRLNVASGDWKMVREGKCLPVLVVGSKVILVADNKLMVSDDVGNTWTRIESFERSANILAITGGQDDSGMVLFITVDGEGVYRSLDGGESWEQVVPFEFQAILQMPGNQTQVAWAVEQNKGRGRKAWRTDDGGSSWREVFRFSGIGRNVEYSWVQTEMKWDYLITTNGFFASRTSPDIAVITTQGDMYRTLDGGRSWHSLVNRRVGLLPDDITPRFASVGLEVTTCYQYLYDPWEPARHYAAFADIGFIRSLDAGQTWSHATKGSPWVNTFYRVVFDPEIRGRLYAAAANRHDIPNWSQLGWWRPEWNIGGPVVSVNFGETWTPLGKGFPLAPCTDLLVSVNPDNGRKMFVACAYGKGVFRSDDDGATWRDITNNIRRDNLNAYRLWQSPNDGALYCLLTAFLGKNNVLFPGGLWKSMDRGETWQELTVGTGIDWPTAFQADPESDKIMYLSVASVPAKKPQMGGVWKTVDGGLTWRRILDDSKLGSWGMDRMMAVAVHPENSSLIYAGGFLNGLWFSTDAGANWKRYEAFPFGSAQSINFDPSDSKKIVVTTFGAGLWAGPHLP